MSMSNPIRKRLFELGLNQARLSDAIGKSDSWISLVATYRRIPKIHEKELVAKALRTTVETLWPVLAVEESEI